MELFLSFYCLLTLIKRSCLVYCVLLSRFWITLPWKRSRTNRFPTSKCKTLSNRPTGARVLQNAVGIIQIRRVINSENWRTCDGISGSGSSEIEVNHHDPETKMQNPVKQIGRDRRSSKCFWN